jgi:urea transport system permease protein
MVLQLLDVVTTAGVLYAVALGLLLVFGVLRIMNLAHGAFLTVGAYAAVLVTRWGLSAWWALVVAGVLGALLGAVVERGVVRWMYDRPLDAILATWGLNLILVQVITLYFGREIQFARGVAEGTVSWMGLSYSAYRLLAVALTCVVGLGTWVAVQRTDIGLKARAVVMNEELAEALGVDTRGVRFKVFCVGAALAAFAGALVTPLISVHPYLGIPWLVNAFMLVLVAGPSMERLVLTALGLGGAQVLVSEYGNPVLGSLTIVVLSVVILRWRKATS